MKPRLFNFRNILFVSILAILATWFGLVWARLEAVPSTLTAVDYITTYTAGIIARTQGLPQAYRPDVQQSVENAITYPAQLVRFYPYNHPPFLIHILQWITTSDYTASFHRWIIVLIVFQVLSLFSIYRLLRSIGWERSNTWVVVVSGLLFYPIFSSYLKGQDSAFVLLGVTTWTFGLLTGRDRLAGLGLVLTAMRPQIALALALPFLFKRRKVWWWFAAWGAIFLVYFYLLIGANGIMDFLRLLLLSSGGIDVDKMPTLMGAIVRTFPNISTSLLHAIGYSGYGLAILFLAIVWVKSRMIEVRHIGLAVLVSMLFSPHLHLHDLSLLLIPVVGSAVILAQQKLLTRENAALIPLGVSALLALNAVIGSYLTYYLLPVLLGLILWLPGRLKPAQAKAME